MPLREDLARQGNWLFRWRSVLPVLAAPLLLLALRDFAYLEAGQRAERVWGAFCLLVSLFGMAVRAYAVGFAPRRTSGRNTKKGQVADCLNTQGAYSLVRNPLYFGNFFVALGAVMFLHVWWLTLIYVVLYWLYYERIVYAEEEFLREKFGDEYIAWAEKTPLFLPRLATWNPHADRPFSWRTVLKREYQTLFYLVLFFAGTKLAVDAAAQGRMVLDPMWVGLCFVSLAFFIVVRFVRKRTRLLDSEGR